MLLPTNFVTALTMPSFAPITNWLITFKRSASSCASNREVMVGVIVVDDAFKAASTLAFAALRTEFTVIASVDFYVGEKVRPIFEQFLHAFARVAWVELAYEDTTDTFLQK